MDKRFGVLMCAVDSEYVKKRYGGYFTLFANMLADPDESWDLYRVTEGHFPATEELCNYRGFVITGSCCDAHGNDTWILRLCNLLQTLYSLRIRVLGICFGHQVLCRALGGKTGRAGAWDIGLTTINLSDSLSQRFPNIQIPCEIRIIEIHQDQIYKVPTGAEVLGSSEKTGIEMFAMGDSVLGIQGHPEYTSDILLSLTERLIDKNLIEEKAMEQVKESLCNSGPDAEVWHSGPDAEVWQKICKGFLKGDMDQTQRTPLELDLEPEMLVEREMQVEMEVRPLLSS